MSRSLTASSSAWTTVTSTPTVDLTLERREALELLALVQATMNAIARSRDLTVGAAILAGIREKLIVALEET